MNKENAHLFLPLVQALADGKTIQSKLSDLKDEWWEDFEEDDEIGFHDDSESYRIKPEPRTWSFWLDTKGNLHVYNITPFSDWKRIEVQEVLG